MEQLDMAQNATFFPDILLLASYFYTTEISVAWQHAPRYVDTKESIPVPLSRRQR